MGLGVRLEPEPEPVLPGLEPVSPEEELPEEVPAGVEELPEGCPVSPMWLPPLPFISEIGS